MIRAFLAFCGVGLAASLAAAGTFRVVPVEGEPFEANVVSAAPDRLEVERDGKTSTLPLDSVRRLTRPDVESSAVSPFVELRGGDRLRGTVVGGGRTEAGPFVRLVFDVDRALPVDLPLVEVRALRWMGDAASDPDHLAQLRADSEALDRPLDRVYVVRDGKLTTMDAAVRGIEEAAVTVLWQGEERRIPRRFILAVLFSGALAKEGADEPEGAGPVVRLQTVHGGHVRARLAGGDAEAFELRRRGVALRIPHARVRQIDVENDRVLYLSDADPVEVVETPWFVDNVWPWRRDRSAAGRPLAVGGRVYEKGIGAHSRSRIVFDLAGDYRRFRAVAGIDDGAGRVGDAAIQVIGDGKVLFELASVKVGAEPAVIDIDVSGVERLALVADYGADYDIGDLVDWCDARVVR